MNKIINLKEIEAQAKAILPGEIYDFYAGGANDEITLNANIKAFEDIALLPRVLRGVSYCDTKISLLHTDLKFPVLASPMAFQKLAHPTGEIALAQACQQAGITAIISTMSSMTLEEIQKVSQANLWLQLYVYKDRALTLDLIKRAEEAGYSAIVLTVDTPLMGKRERDIRNQFCLPADSFAANFNRGAASNALQTKMSNSAIKAFTDKAFDCLSWNDIHWLRSHTNLPIILKGIMRPTDARTAIGCGVQSIIVSNHGGRQLDTTAASIIALPKIAKEVAGKIPVLLDGGIRRGTDILKALAFGASAVLLGRPLLWGLALAGKQGVSEVLTVLEKEFREAMILCGCSTIADILLDHELIG